MDPDLRALLIIWRPFDAVDFGVTQAFFNAVRVDQAMGEPAPTQESRLLQMPPVVLAKIVDMLADDKKSLASLAGASRFSRSLARTRQFAQVDLDYSDGSLELIEHLANELTLTSTPASQHGVGTLGANIRMLKIETDGKYVLARHDEMGYSLRGNRYSQAEKDRLLQEATDHYEAMKGGILTALAHGMPNLDTVVFNDRVVVRENFLPAMMLSKASHFEFSELYLSPDVVKAFVQESFEPATWPLKSLLFDSHVVISPTADGKSPEVETAWQFHETLLRRVAPTVEALTWGHRFHGAPSFREETVFSSEPIEFPRLQSLVFRTARITPSFFAKIFNGAPSLRHLTLPIEYGTREFPPALDMCPRFPDLETLVIPGMCDLLTDGMVYTRFLEKHSHVKKLTLYEAEAAGEELPTAYLNSLLILTITPQRFTNLTSLSLYWGGWDGWKDEGLRPARLARTAVVLVSPKALRAIGTLTTLEQLCLGAGWTLDWRNQWLIDHGQIRQHLGRLKKLRKLAFRRDTYRHEKSMFDDEYYRTRGVVNSDVHAAFGKPALDAEIGAPPLLQNHDADTFNKAIWERAHRNRMVDIAEAHARVFPALDWIYVGQLHMAIRPGRRAVPLTLERNVCNTFLWNMFCMETSFGDSPDLSTAPHNDIVQALDDDVLAQLVRFFQLN
ncbi:hypothetical protein M426DRAFT_11476 [Hypoxylon sp. CI-4A]|nr:hypothetical protein M426DRAFT_11476 [Hypoxylon sp. CI-4A]